MRRIAIRVAEPEAMSDPVFVTRLVTITAMYAGTVDGGVALVPPVVVQVQPVAGGVVEIVLAKPLNAAGAAGASGFADAQAVDQKVTVAPVTADLLPTTIEPRDRYVNTVVVPLAVAPSRRSVSATFARTGVGPSVVPTVATEHVAIPSAFVMALQDRAPAPVPTARITVSPAMGVAVAWPSAGSAGSVSVAASVTVAPTAVNGATIPSASAVSSRTTANAADVDDARKAPFPANAADTVYAPAASRGVIAQEAVPAASVTSEHVSAPSSVKVTAFPTTGAPPIFSVRTAATVTGSLKSPSVSPVYASDVSLPYVYVVLDSTVPAEAVGVSVPPPAGSVAGAG